MKMQPTEREKIFPTHIFDKELITKIHQKAHETQLQNNNLKRMKNGQTFLLMQKCIDIFPKKTYRWPTREVAHH